MKKHAELIVKLLHRFGWWRIEDLAVGAHCGLCGKWIEDEIVPAEGYRVSICKQCERG